MNSRKHQDFLYLPFLYMTLCGMWKPRIPNFLLEVIFDLFTAFMIIICETVILTEILGILFTDENMSQVLLENISIIVTMIAGFLKMLNIISKRKKITLLTESCLTELWNPPRDQVESLIITKYDKLARYISLSYVTMVCGNCLNFIIIPIVSRTWVPPLYAWYPCNMSLSICFWPCYLHQSTGFLTIGAVHVACETLITGFILQICAQLNILNHRVLSINLKIQNLALCKKDKRQIFLFELFLTKACIVDHNGILKFAELLSETFFQVLFIQFGASLTVIGTSIYSLSTFKVYSVDFVKTIVYLICLLNQMLLYCWYSNEVLLNSKKLFQSIYNTDWMALHGKTQKTLLLMMLVASSPIQLFKGAIIKVNLDAFLNVLKFSYSAFNILKNPSKDFD